MLIWKKENMHGRCEKKYSAWWHLLFLVPNCTTAISPEAHKLQPRRNLSKHAYQDKKWSWERFCWTHGVWFFYFFFSLRVLFFIKYSDNFSIVMVFHNQQYITEHSIALRLHYISTLRENLKEIIITFTALSVKIRFVSIT